MNENIKDCPYNNDCYSCMYCLSEWSEQCQDYVITGCTWYKPGYEVEQEIDLETLIF